MTHTHHTWHCAAGVYALCDRPDKAVEQLRHCADVGLPNYRMFAVDPSLQALRAEPEFQTLLSDLRREHDQYVADVDMIGNI